MTRESKNQEVWHSEKYSRARDVVWALNRFVKPTIRRRRGERKGHFVEDRRKALSLLDDPNILGFGVGPKRSRGKEVDELSLVFFVKRKLPKMRLRYHAEIPNRFLLRTKEIRIQTDVQEWGGTPVAHSAVSAGASIGDVSGNAGTMTLAVQDVASGSPLLLGCSHVIALCGNAQVGDEVESPAASARPRIVGRLLRFARVDPKVLTNHIDAAVAEPVAGVTFDNSIPGIGALAGIRDLTLEAESAVRGLPVRRFGISTELQTGAIRNLHITTRIIYDQLPGDPSVRFVELVQYDAPAAGGDSGAAVVDDSEDPRVVGMHIAGTPDATASFFTHIQFVFNHLQIDMLS
jgi:hypothetical protein